MRQKIPQIRKGNQTRGEQRIETNGTRMAELWLDVMIGKKKKHSGDCDNKVKEFLSRPTTPPKEEKNHGNP